MSNPSKRKGTAWEVAIRDYLLELGFRVNRHSANGVNDIGDLSVDHAGEHYVLEAKAQKTLDLSGFLAEAAREAAAWAALNKVDPDKVHPVVIVKRRNHGVDRAYVVQELKDWVNDHPGL